MKRVSLLVVALLALAGVFAATATARGGNWTPDSTSPFDWQCGSAVVHVTWPVGKEYSQTTTNPDGTQTIKTTGSLKVNLATDAGNSLLVNASGPSQQETFNPVTGDLDFVAQGQSVIFFTPAQAAATGLPEIFSTSGPVDILYRGDGTVQVNKLNLHTVTDLCAALTG